MRIQELKQKKARLITEARAFQEQREAAGNFTADDRAAVDRMIDDATECDLQIAQEERLLAAEREAAASSGAPPERSTDSGEEPAGEHRDHRGRPLTDAAAVKMAKAWERFIRSGHIEPELAELRALEAGDDTAGGYTIPLQKMSARLLKNADDQVFVRRFATIEQLTGAQSLGFPSLVDPSDSEWTSELLTGSADSTMAFNKRELRAYPLAKRILVSNRLLNNSSRNIVDLINERFGYKFGITMETAYLTGSGSGQPLGVFVASANGIDTDRDFVIGSTTAITADGLKGAKYRLKGAYHARARWLFHRDAVRAIALLREDTGAGAGTGSYMFDVDSDRLMGMPLDASEYVPNTYTSGLYAGMLCDWQAGYTVVDSLAMNMQRLVEVYAESNQVAFIARYEGDGAPVLPEAFARLKMG